METARTLVDQIAESHGPLATTLAAWVVNYRFDTLQALMEEMEQ